MDDHDDDDDDYKEHNGNGETTPIGATAGQSAAAARVLVKQGLLNESLLEEGEEDEDDEDQDSDVFTIVTISTPIHTPHTRSPAPARRTPPRASTVASAVAAVAATSSSSSVTVVVPAMCAEDEADLRTLRSQGLVRAALRERTAGQASAPTSQGGDAELLQSLRTTRRVAGLLGESAFVRTLEATLQNRPASGGMRVPPVRRRPTSSLVTGSHAEGLREAAEAGAAGVMVGSAALHAVAGGEAPVNGIRNEIVLLSRSRPVTRVLQSEQRQVLEIFIRHRIEQRQQGGRGPSRANPTGVLLRQAHRMREAEMAPQQHQGQGQQAAEHAAAPANAITISVLQAQIRIMAEQMAEMARMVTATYQLQQDMQRTMNQQVAAVFHTFQVQAEYAQAAAAAGPGLAPTPTAAAAAAAAAGPAAHMHAGAMAGPMRHSAAAAAGAGAMAGSDAGGSQGTVIGPCVICSQQVDSVLYRCGHMCVCGLCARQLKAQDQWCPMCRAPIEDIVRVYHS